MIPDSILEVLTEFVVLLDASLVLKIVLVAGATSFIFLSVLWAAVVYVLTIEKITPAGPVRWVYHGVFLGVIPFLLFFSRPPLTIWIDPLGLEVATKWFYLAGFILWGYINIPVAYAVYTWEIISATKRVNATIIGGAVLFAIIGYGIYFVCNALYII